MVSISPLIIPKASFQKLHAQLQRKKNFLDKKWPTSHREACSEVVIREDWTIHTGNSWKGFMETKLDAYGGTSVTCDICKLDWAFQMYISEMQLEPPNKNI